MLSWQLAATIRHCEERSNPLPSGIDRKIASSPRFSHSNRSGDDPGFGRRDTDLQYVARPPEISNTAPVEKLHSSLASHRINEATSSMSPKRPMGIFESIQSICVWVICSNNGVFTAAGVTQLTRISLPASSLPKDFVSPMTPAFDAE
jgi:hypothetical protein